MKKNNVNIIGCNISSLYAAIKCLDLGYNVTILEKKDSILPLSDALYNNYKLFNSSHKQYINLLKRFSININAIKIDFNEKILKIINTVIEKSKIIPMNIILTYSFKNLISQILNNSDQEELKIYDTIFNSINAYDCINLFSNDINSKYKYYYINDKEISILINKMCRYIFSKNGKIIYNIHIKNINYINNKYYLYQYLLYEDVFCCDILLSTISIKNLSLFTFWSKDQLNILNSVNAASVIIVKDFLNNIFNLNNIELGSDNTRQQLLENLHIVYPHYNKSQCIYLWKKGVNSILMREKIRNMYNNNFYICSESYSKNNLFINYSLDNIDQCLSKLFRYSSR